MRTLTALEAKTNGLSASQIRTVARSLQRLAEKGYAHPDGKGGIVNIRPLCNPAELRRNAWNLFKIAKEMK